MQNNMIPLTVANTLDQTTKQRIEAKPNETLKQAVQARKLALKAPLTSTTSSARSSRTPAWPTIAARPSTWAWPRWRGARGL